MAIRGSLKEASLPDVLQLLALGRKTGCLAVADRHNFGYIYFERGRITYASIVNRRDRLGDILVKNGQISQSQLEQAMARQATDRGRKLGEILVDDGAISRADLESYIRLQIEEAVYYLFTWNSGTFNFEAGITPDEQDFLVQINPESLLLEGARRVDEWSIIEKKIPSFDIIFTLDSDHVDRSDVSLSPHQQRLLPLLDGTRDIRQLIEDAGLVEFEVGQALYGLLTAGFLHRTGTTATAAPRARDVRVEEHRNLGVAFYKTGMLEEAKREYRRVEELRPADPDAPRQLGQIALRESRWGDAVHALARARDLGGDRADVCHNLGVALEHLGQDEDAEGAYARAVDLGAGPAALTGWAILALRRDDAAKARDRLTDAREAWGDATPSPLWFWAAMMSAALQDDVDEAVEVGREGIAAWPSNPVLRNNLAVLLELRGDVGEAESLVREALEEAPTLPQITKNLGDLLYRAGRYDEARDAYQRAARLAPELGDDLYFKLGNIAYRQRDPDTARHCWERATAINPGHELARTNLETLGAGQ